MKAEPRLIVEGLGKKYAPGLKRALWYGARDVVDECLGRRSAARDLRRGEFWALQDVSFSLQRGEALAVLGHNGAGKSTLLKLLFGVLKPDRGEIRVRGRMEGLIELGSGVNPLLSGRENIRLWAALHGFSARRAAELVEIVLDFSELGDFIDAPVQSYSSGMGARLAYALAVNLEPQILLVDEVLAVGDVGFQRKCLAHMQDYLRGGGSLIFVSHNTYQVQAVCERGLLLDRGQVAFAGTAVEALARMLRRREEAPAEGGRGPATAPIAITSVSIAGPDGGAPVMGSPTTIALRCRSDRELEVGWGFGVWTQDQWICVTGEYRWSGVRLREGETVIQCVLPRLPLLPGRYLLRLAVIDPATKHPFALWGWEDAGTWFDVVAEDDALTNAQLQLNQLLRVDVEWL